MQEIPTTIFIPVISATVYLAVVYVINYMRAMMRVPVYHQREVTRLTQEQEQNTQNLRDTHHQTENTLRQQITALTAQLDTRTRRREQRETLAHFLNHGNELLRIYTSPEDVASEPRDKWAYEVENYLSTSFDTSYSVRWNNSIGIASYYSLNTEVSKENQFFLRDIHWRLVRLQEFIKELRDEE